MSFGRDMDRFIGRYQRKVSRVEKRTAEKLADSLADTTPVDTGYAAGNWQGGVGHDPGGKVDRHGREAGKAHMRAVIAAWPAGATLYLTNHAPYINVLEHGDAKHQPHGMLRITLQRARRFVYEANAETR